MAGQKSCKRWFIDLNSSSVQKTELPPPFSFTKKSNVEHVEHSRDVDPDLIVKRSWDIALGPIKQIPMNLFMLWMAGNTVSLFPIMMVGMLLFRSVSAFFSLGATFKTIEGAQAPLQKLTFIAGNVLAVLMGLYKCNSMGLLPTHASDWLAFAQPPQQMEYSSGGISLT